MFLRDDKVDFSLFLILFTLSWFTFGSCVGVSSGLFGLELFGCVVFLFSEDGGLFRWDCFFFVNTWCVWYCILYYLFYGVFLLFQVQKINLSLLLTELAQHVLSLSEN